MCTLSCCDCEMLVETPQCKMFGFLPVPFTGVSDENDGTSAGKGVAVVSGNGVIGGGGGTGSTVLEGISVGVSVDEGIFVGTSVGRSEDGGPVGCDVALAVSLGTGTGTAGAAVVLSPVASPFGGGAAGAAVARVSPFTLPVFAVYVATDSEIVLPSPSTATWRTTDTVWTTAVTVLFGGVDG